MLTAGAGCPNSKPSLERRAVRQILQLWGCKGQSPPRFAGVLRFAGKQRNQVLDPVPGGAGRGIFAGGDFTVRLGVEASTPLVFS